MWDRKMRWMIILCVSCAWLWGCGPVSRKPIMLPTVNNGVTLQGRNVQGLNEMEVRTIVEELAATMLRRPTNAYFDRATGQIKSGSTGQFVDIHATVQQVMNSPAGTAVQTVLTRSEPQINEQKLLQAAVKGSFRTQLIDDSAGRVNNIKLACAQINNAILAPGAIFSFNQSVGEPSADQGYQPAPILTEDGGHDLGIGGGVCQVSSTLYNAVLAAGLEIVERHPHSQPVNYVAPGRDATTFTDKDFKFRNNSARYVIIRALVPQQAVQVDIFALPE